MNVKIVFYIFILFIFVSVLATTYTTVTIDGTITTDWEANEDMGAPTGEPTWKLWFTWDANYVYMGWDGPDWTPSNNNAILAYFDARAGGTTTGLEGETLGISADFAIKIKQNRANSGYYTYTGSWPGSPTVLAAGEMEWTSSGAEVTEVRISWSDLTNGESSGPTPFNFISVDILNNGNFNAAWPSNNTDLASKTFTFAWEQTGGSGIIPSSATIKENPPDQALPVELSSFSASVNDDKVILNWQTQSEINNLGFAVLRSEKKDSEYESLADYTDTDILQGLGTSPHGKNYSFIDNTVFSGKQYWYKIQDIDVNGVATEHGPISVNLNKQSDLEVSYVLPEKFLLSANYPNPFNPSTKFRVDIPTLKEELSATVNIYDMLGRKVKTLYDGPIFSGSYTLSWDGNNNAGFNMPAGVYIYTISSAAFSSSKKMILIK